MKQNITVKRLLELYHEGRIELTEAELRAFTALGRHQPQQIVYGMDVKEPPKSDWTNSRPGRTD